jgi:hypothetical protein
MRAAALIGMIDQEGIALHHVGAEGRDHGACAGRERPDMQRQHDMLRHNLAARVHQRAGGILRFAHDGGEAGPEQRVLHLLHDAGEARLHHFEIDRVDRHHPSPSVTIRFFHLSTHATWPGQISVVLST